MDKEAIGVILGWLLVTVAAWFAALALLGYIGGSVFPWEWPPEKRALHLVVQFVLIIGYSIWRRPRGR